MLTQPLPVQPELRNTIDALELKEQAFPFKSGAQPKMLPVPANSAPVSRRSVYGVVGVPGMWQTDGLPFRVVVVSRCAFRNAGSMSAAFPFSRSIEPNSPVPADWLKRQWELKLSQILISSRRPAGGTGGAPVAGTWRAPAGLEGPTRPAVRITRLSRKLLRRIFGFSVVDPIGRLASGGAIKSDRRLCPPRQRAP
jgi:hypothetical protein